MVMFYFVGTPLCYPPTEWKLDHLRKNVQHVVILKISRATSSQKCLSFHTVKQSSFFFSGKQWRFEKLFWRPQNLEEEGKKSFWEGLFELRSSGEGDSLRTLALQNFVITREGSWLLCKSRVLLPNLKKNFLKTPIPYKMAVVLKTLKNWYSVRCVCESDCGPRLLFHTLCDMKTFSLVFLALIYSSFIWSFLGEIFFSWWLSISKCWGEGETPLFSTHF